MARYIPLLLAANLTLCMLPSEAAEVAFSGYGTVGYARSNQSYRYQRYIDSNGTFDRDSDFGVQMDASFTPELGGTVQVKLAPSDSSDNQWKPVLSWVFVSWRPSNDWLLRVGKLRIPLLLFSESQDVGLTYDYARLPTEMYGISPISDFLGTSFSKSWELGGGNMSLDGYWGQASPTFRSYVGRAIFTKVDIESYGLALSYRSNDYDNTYRMGVHNPTIKARDAGLGFSEMRMPVVTLGANIGLGNNVRLVAEYLAMFPELGGRTTTGNLSLLKKIGDWTPYVYASGQFSGATTLTHSWAIGTSYSLSATSKFKGEWSRSHTGTSSGLIDAPLGRNVSNTNINVLSLSYSFTF